MKKIFYFISTNNVIIVLFCFLINNSCTSSFDDEVSVYKDVLPQIIKQEMLLKPFMPLPPTLELKEEYGLTNRKIYEIEDSLRVIHEKEWTNKLKNTDNLLLIKDTLINIDTSYFFINVREFLSETRDFERLYNKLTHKRLKSIKFDIDKIGEVTGYEFKEIAKIESKDYFDLGYLTLSRVSLNINRNKGCFGLFYCSVDSFQNFEMLVLVTKNENKWEIFKNTRD